MFIIKGKVYLVDRFFFSLVSNFPNYETVTLDAYILKKGTLKVLFFRKQYKILFGNADLKHQR